MKLIGAGLPRTATTTQMIALEQLGLPCYHMRNLMTNAGIALLFMVPGVDETLRVNGEAVLTTDPAILEQCAIDATVPRVAVTVTVREAYIHCAKAFRRSGLWTPEAWPDRSVSQSS